MRLMLSGRGRRGARPTALLGLGALLALCFASPRAAQAQSTLRYPEDRPDYTFEIEPHLTAAPISPPGDGTGAGIGAGLRGTLEIVRHGFIRHLNNSVGIGIGADFLHYGGNGVVRPGTCRTFSTGPGGTLVCTEVSQIGGSSNYAFLPVTMQWNFWLTRQWSAFGEPGLAFYWFDYRSFGAVPALFLGGRFHFSDAITLTLRIGYPTFSLGVSFML